MILLNTRRSIRNSGLKPLFWRKYVFPFFGLGFKPHRYFARTRTRHTPKFVLWLIITMIPRFLRVPSVLGSLGLY